MLEVTAGRAQWCRGDTFIHIRLCSASIVHPRLLYSVFFLIFGWLKMFNQDKKTFLPQIQASCRRQQLFPFRLSAAISVCELLVGAVWNVKCDGFCAPGDSPRVKKPSDSVYNKQTQEPPGTGCGLHLYSVKFLVQRYQSYLFFLWEKIMWATA